jgi:hypothetical protein
MNRWDCKREMGTNRKLWAFVVIVLLVGVVVRGWLRPLPSGYSIDETGTYFIISGTWEQFVSRMAHAIQSPAHSVILWGISQLGISSEVGLRLPSVVFMALALYALHQIGGLLADRETGLLAALLFASLPEVSFNAALARPYSLALASGMLAVWLFLKWWDSPSPLGAAKFAATMAFLAYCHVLFLSLGVALAIFLLSSTRSRPGPTPRQALLVAGVVLALSAPIVPYYVAAASDVSSYTVFSSPSLRSFLDTVGSPSLAAALALVAAIACLVGRRVQVPRTVLRPGALRLLILWGLVPPVALFVVAVLSPAKVFAGRYIFVALPPFALVAALLLRTFVESPTRLAVAAATAAILVFYAWPLGGPRNFGHDWRATITALRPHVKTPDTPVFVKSGFVEAKSRERLENPEYRAFILAPLAAYPLDANVVALPLFPGAEYEPYLHSVAATVEASHHEFFLIEAFGRDRWLTWFRAKAGAAGFRDREIVGGEIRVHHFQRTIPSGDSR